MKTSSLWRQRAFQLREERSTQSCIVLGKAYQAWLKSQLWLSKPKESLIDLNIKSDIQHTVYLKQITGTQWNPKTPVGGCRVKWCVSLINQKPILNHRVYLKITLIWGCCHYKWCLVSTYKKRTLLQWNKDVAMLKKYMNYLDLILKKISSSFLS